jgi:hypothetical protein
MDAIAFFGAIVAALGALGLFSSIFGADSRPWINDEWRRLY